jgi:hypothetical protein
MPPPPPRPTSRAPPPGRTYLACAPPPRCRVAGRPHLRAERVWRTEERCRLLVFQSCPRSSPTCLWRQGRTPAAANPTTPVRGPSCRARVVPERGPRHRQRGRTREADRRPPWGAAGPARVGLPLAVWRLACNKPKMLIMTWSIHVHHFYHHCT